MKKKLILQLFALLVFGIQVVNASKLQKVQVVDKDHIMLFFQDGIVTFTESGTNTGNAANTLVSYGSALTTGSVATVSNWKVISSDDANYGATGKNPSNVYRKSKLTGMAQGNWNTSTNDFDYSWAYEHTIYLKLPNSLEQGKTYTIQINAALNSDLTTSSFTFDYTSSKSDAIHVNIAGYLSADNIKSADVYMWMGDGGARSYTSFQGNKVYLINTQTNASTQVGTLTYWKAKSTEMTNNHNMIQSDVWNADFTSFKTPGTYRLAIEGIGCSDQFVISADAYALPFKVSTLGFYYMRIGQTAGGITPTPRQPLWIPNQSPSDCKVYITTMQPYHANWSSLGSGDKWDLKDPWAAYSTGRLNANAYGGHSDALDWDRHLGHVSIIYDMLLPYFLSDGSISEDNIGITESGNSIPDIIDEARNEVDFWLRLRDGKGYSHGINNPNSSNILYQAGNTAVAAWANAANAAMLANCFMIDGNTALMQRYRDSAINAYTYANGLADQMLTNSQNIGAGVMTGKDFKITAAAFLYNVTGNTVYEDAVNSLSTCTGSTSTIFNASQNQLYATAAYLFTKQPVHYTTLWNNMKASIINEAKQKEANYSLSRPSRRASDNDNGWFVTEMVLQRTIIAHAISDPGADKTLLENALFLEADWTLGRNPLNMIQMTTATTGLASKNSVPNAYTSGWNDGTAGVHPGHTPYMNIYDWGGLIMGNPTWMTNKNYPAATNWPYGEMYYNTRYVYAANEFTPQQTMRCKTALYGYLHSLSPAIQQGCATPDMTAPSSICGTSSATISTGLNANGKTFTWYKDDVLIASATLPTLAITQAGTYKVEVDSNSCVKSAQATVSGTLQLDLGADQNLCTNTEVTLDAGNETVPGVTYSWNNGITTRSLIAGKAGTYSVTVSALNCPSVSDNVIITSSLLDVIEDTICSAGTANLSVSGTGTYSWYDQSAGGTALATGNSYSPSITASKTYYVEEAGGFATTIGKDVVGTGSSWGLGGTDLGGTDKIIKVTVSQPVTIKSIAVYTSAAGQNVTINLSQNSTVIHTATATNVGSGKQDILLNFNVAPGEYILDALGSTATLIYEASGAAFPYSHDGYISFTYNESWQSDWYGLFYDWNILVGSSCARTPVQAILDENYVHCNSTITQTISLAQGWNLFSTNVHPADSSIATLFTGLNVQSIKNISTFWLKGQSPFLNTLVSVTAGEGYLIYMNAAGTLTVTGIPISILNFQFSISNAWHLIGCPYQTPTSFSTDFNSANCQIIKNFDGFWEPTGTQNSIQNMEPGKGYFVK